MGRIRAAPKAARCRSLGGLVIQKLSAAPFLLVLVCAIVLFSSARTRAESLDVQELYRRAVIAMNDLPVPPYVTYRLESTGAGAGVHIQTERCTTLYINFESNSVRWTVRGRTSDGLAEIVDADGARNIVGFDSTWAETYRQLRSGALRDYRNRCTPPALHAPEPLSVDAKPEPAVRVIGTIRAIGPGIYRAEDRGAVACENGDPGRALHLTSRTNNRRQQLTDVIVDERSLRFCMVRFGARLGEGVAVDGVYEQHFADVGGFFVQTSGSVELTERIAGISTKHGISRYRLLDIAFPRSLPLETFAPTPNVASAYVQPQQLVDIGGRRLNVYCTGDGLPTVLLEAGGGESSLDWRFVQPVLTKKMRVCSYDRAGLGFSDRGPLPRDAAAAVDDLHALVERGAIRKPFVLVGYSNGALYSRLYADRHLGDLAGLVLVEPAFEGDEEMRVDAAAPTFARQARTMETAAASCAAATVTPVSCALPPDPQLPQTLNDALRDQSLRPGWWTDYFSENATSARTTTLAQVRDEQRSYGALPFALVTAGNIVPPGALPTAEERSIREILRAGRAPLIRLSSRGYRAEAPECSHGDILFGCVDAVVRAIAAVLTVR